MKILLVGVGGVGEAIASIAKPRPWVEQVVLADYNLARAQEVEAKLCDPKRFPAEFIDENGGGPGVRLRESQRVKQKKNKIVLLRRRTS